MKSTEYLAVFKSLSYAGRVRHEFIASKQPSLIKTPKRVMDGCSYSLLFPEEQLEFMKRVIKNHRKGFIGFYRQIKPNHYEEISYDLS